SGMGIAELPAGGSAATLTATAIDWNALAREGESGPAPTRPVDFSSAPPPTVELGDADEPDRRSGSDRRTGDDRRRVDRRTDDRRAAPPPEVIPGAGAAVGAATLRVNLERIESLMNLVGELVTTKNAINQIAEKMKAETGFKGTTLEVFKAKRVLERRLDELQKGIMQVRMLPLEQLFSKLTRVVRNLSRENGKDVELVIEGAETELDKVMIDELSDPLIHIVRNAVDHGIEPLDVRLAKGKPGKGTIRIHAFPKGNHVAIEIADDGGGLDAERIRQKAIEKRLLSPEAQPSQEELFDLIYAPGFSTKEEVSEVSGRGVGMDVVRNNIMKLNGIIDTQSERWVGTRFTITLPLTLATMKALVVGVYGQTYAIPLASVLECVTTKSSALRTVESREMLPLRETTLPLIRLDRFFSLRAADDVEPDEEDRRLHVVVVGLAQYRIGLVVDTLGAQQDVVVKPLGAPLTRVPGIMGATNLGNNRAVLVLDVAGVVNSSVGGRTAAEGRA
ncbi:MAG TPA: chemotaxis protein CheA, partial [bacterium]|nr:chemotaxis protein CheA [bacterium]